MSVLSLRQVSKSYRKYPNEFARVAAWFGLRSTKIHTLEVLKPISFDVLAGESVAIVGQNGAGKSTLLKMIVGTLNPSSGSIQVHGKVAAILELGMGFNPDFTGRQNAMHGLALMGYNAAQIEAVLPELEAFAEIGDYFDQPLRVYSSGMQMRVAFAVATAFRPDLLIVDEALSVGDAYFQHKSFERIKQFQQMGTSLLLVSHDKTAIQTVCNRALLLANGQIIREGRPDDIMDYYNALIAEKENSQLTQQTLTSGLTQTYSGTGEVQILSVQLLSDTQQPLEVVRVNQAVQLRVKVKVKRAIPQLVLGYALKDRLGQVVFGTNTWHTQQIIHHLQPDEEIEYTIDFTASLGEGSYAVVVALTDSETHLTANYAWLERAWIFEVVNTDKPVFEGMLWQESHIQIHRETHE